MEMENGSNGLGKVSTGLLNLSDGIGKMSDSLRMVSDVFGKVSNSSPPSSPPALDNN